VLPDVPTIAESALPGYNTGSWYGLVGPAGIPKNVLDLLSGEVGRILRNREIREDFARAGFEPEGTTPEAFAGFVRSEIEKYEQVIRKANLKPLAD
jgi:tripartite-type tricarboxylate transporter receptor subunit TctC